MPCAKTRISMVTACSSSSSMRRVIPGAAAQPCHHACAAVACQRPETVGLPPSGHFGTSTFTVGFTRYHCASLAFVPTHQAPRLQGTCKARYQTRG